MHWNFRESVRMLLCVMVAAALGSLPAHGSIVSGGDLWQSPVVGQGEEATAYLNSDAHSATDVPVVRKGTSVTLYAPHHAGASSHNGHFFAETGDDDHFAWFSATPTSPGSIDVKYDFRDIGAFSNGITTAQKARAVDALDAWSAATGGRLTFTLDTGTSLANIINIGTGDLAALGSTSGSGGILGLGGGAFSHAGGAHSITSGVAWQDVAENWDTTIGNGNPGGTFDYFTVVAQEIGHALGLGHTSSSADIMHGSYIVEKTALSSVDVDHVTSVYGVFILPEPSSIVIWALLGFALAGFSGRHRAAKK